MDCGPVADGAELSTAAVGACAAASDAVGNSGRTREFVSCRHCHEGRQPRKAALLGRDGGQVGVLPAGVVPTDVLGKVGPRVVHAGVGLEAHLRVLDAAPWPLDRNTGAPRATPIPAQLTTLAQHRVGKFEGREPICWVVVDNIRLPRRATAGSMALRAGQAAKVMAAFAPASGG